MNIRAAEERDLQALLDIYNYEVLHGTATFDLHPKTMTQWRRWFDSHNVDNHPLLVAQEADGTVTGYASLSPYREKDAYRSTVELSVYIAPEYRRRGIAGRLMAALLEQARGDERTHTVVSVITGENEASRRLHERFGFDFCGAIREVGMKFGRYLDIENYSLRV